MSAELDLDRFARTLGDATRMRMLVLLMEGRALTAKELAYGAGVEPATATSHLARLRDDGLLTSVAQGRHKYFRLASADVARLVESVMVLAPRAARPAGAELKDLRLARFCYDHLAGRLGTGLADALVSTGALAEDGDGFAVTDAGIGRFAALGVDVAAVRRGRRRFAARCLDWSERRDHLAGSLGAALADRLLALGWIERRRDTRAVRITDAGRRGLRDALDCEVESGRG
jgi:DNA-binding transcriptional ArsR family regulator